MFTINQVAPIIKGTVIGNGDLVVKGMSSPRYAEEGDITFGMDEAGFATAATCKASCVISTVEIPGYPKTIIKVKDMKEALVILYNAMISMKVQREGYVHPTAIIGGGVKIGKNVSVGAYTTINAAVEIGDGSVIGNRCSIGERTKIGNGVKLFDNVVIYPETTLGNNVIMHSGVVIGADGFGYIVKDGKIYKVPQLGGVMIGDNVEIGANSCIDRGTFMDTVIKSGTKIDNIVQIAHNVQIGNNVFIAALTGIGGTSEVGDNTMIGGSVGIADHVKIGKNVKVGGKTGVTGNIKDGETVFGYPHRTAEEARKLHGVMSVLYRNEKAFRKFLRTLSKDPLE
ncbi:MAG: UDP-3-O-(3-hydroxymyristoyl)glucosamine N-acyltransferase [Candidatus Omnitrophica bacterium]|nr:UDP-3-O-(3-hydroxymyristoyl)glucosamine N-acyltransferase [Candidatus Omnitrophota bacterium]